MKLIPVLIVISMLLLPTVSAEELEYDPGIITPDSPLWEVELILEEVVENVMLTTDSRVRLQMKHANERIGEMRHTTNPDKVIEQYIKVMNKVQSAQELSYTTASAVQEQLNQHSNKISTLAAESAEKATQIQTSEMLQTLTQTQIQIEEHAKNIMKVEAVWWTEKLSEYNIISTPTPIENYGNFESFTKHLNEGITVIDVVRSDATLMGTYMINKVGDVITIQSGTTANFVDKYTISIEELKKYEELL